MKTHRKLEHEPEPCIFLIRKIKNGYLPSVYQIEYNLQLKKLYSLNSGPEGGLF